MATQSTILQQLSKALHVPFEASSRGPLPQRWVELIHYLNEQERISRKSAETIDLRGSESCSHIVRG